MTVTAELTQIWSRRTSKPSISVRGRFFRILSTDTHTTHSHRATIAAKADGRFPVESEILFRRGHISLPAAFLYVIQLSRVV